MKFIKKSILLVFLLSIVQVDASELTNENNNDDINKVVKEATNESTFNGTVMISRSVDNGFDILYESPAGNNGGYDLDTIYDVGSISKIYTTVAIMMLEEDGLVSYDTSISEYLDDVPDDKKDITIEMLLTHSSGINVEENEDHTVSKEEEINRILTSDLHYTPGTNFTYSNSGFSLLAAIIESVSGLSYEEYVTENIFIPLNLERTGFPNSTYLDGLPAVAGNLDGQDYGIVTEFEYGWYSKGYSDILTTPRELTYFAQALVGGQLIDEDNLQLMYSDTVDLSNDRYRGYGTDVRNYKKKNAIVGHMGIWYGGNSVVVYRPNDKIMFTLMCDYVDVTYDLPAVNLFKELNTTYKPGSLSNIESIETVAFNVQNDISSNNDEIKVNETTNASDNYQPLSKNGVKTGIRADYNELLIFVESNVTMITWTCITLIIIICLSLNYRLKTKKRK